MNGISEDFLWESGFFMHLIPGKIDTHWSHWIFLKTISSIFSNIIDEACPNFQRNDNPQGPLLSKPLEKGQVEWSMYEWKNNDCTISCSEKPLDCDGVCKCPKKALTSRFENTCLGDQPLFRMMLHVELQHEIKSEGLSSEIEVQKKNQQKII